MREAELRTISSRGIELAAWDWPGENPPLLFVHATGFHGRCWDRIVRELGDLRSIEIDLRGHGQSSKPAPPYHWPEFGRDVVAVAEALHLDSAIGVGHSLGGHALVTAVLERPETCASLLLIDPTIFEPWFYGTPPGDSSYIARRRNVWKSSEEMFERFRDRSPFSVWQPEVLWDYCNFGLRRQNGEFVLACPPEIEAAVYAACAEPEASLYPRLGGISQPVTVMRAGTPWSPGVFDLNSSPAAASLAAAFAHGRDLHLTDHSHYIPMESPGLVAAEIRAILPTIPANQPKETA